MENQTGWPDQLFDVLKRVDVRQVGYVPDAGHARLIERCKDVDLHRWFSGAYAIPAAESADDSEEQENVRPREND